MPKYNRHTPFALVANACFILALVVPVAASATPEMAARGDKTVKAPPAVPPSKDAAATADAGVVTVLDVMLEFNRLLPMQSFHGNVRPKERKRLAKKALRNVLLIELASQAGRKKGMKVAPSEIAQEYTRRTMRFKHPSDLPRILEKLALDRKTYDQMIERDLLAGKYMAKYFDRPVTVSDEELKKYYETNPHRFKQPPAVRLQLIEMRVDPSAGEKVWKSRRQEAEELRKKLAAGTADFTEMAKKHSGHETAKEGGDVGWVHQGSMNKSLETKAFELKKGEVSEVVQNLYGFNIMKLNDRRESRQLEFKEINLNYWRKQLEASKSREQRERAEAALLKNGNVKYVGNAIDKVLAARPAPR